jgi:hypothetical protein
MSEAKSNNPQIWAAVISATALIIVALIGKCNFSAPPQKPEEVTNKPAPISDSGSVNALPKMSAPPKMRPNSSGDVAQSPLRPDTSKSGGVRPIETSQFSAAPPQRFKGQVVDENGQGVSGVEVVCTDCEATGQITRTDQQGNFSLPVPIERKHDIQQIHLSLSKDGRSANYYVAVGETAVLTFSLQ